MLENVNRYFKNIVNYILKKRKKNKQTQKILLRKCIKQG